VPSPIWPQRLFRTLVAAPRPRAHPGLRRLAGSIVGPVVDDAWPVPVRHPRQHPRQGTALVECWNTTSVIEAVCARRLYEWVTCVFRPANTSQPSMEVSLPCSGRSVDAEAGLAWDSTRGTYDGRVYLVYTDEIRYESNDTDIFVRFSDNEGLTWSRRIRVNDDGGHNSQFNPHIEVDPTTGNVGVSFHDARRDHGAGGPADTDGRPNTDAQYWAAVSTNGGQGFGPNIKVSEGTSNAKKADNGVDYGDYTGMDFFAGEMHAAWADNSNSTGDNPAGALGTFDVYTATLRVR
jgi:hypothetical protein